MFEIIKSEWSHSEKVTRFVMLVSIGNCANKLAPEYIATVSGYVESAGYHLRIDTVSPIQPLDAVILMAYMGAHEEYMIEEIKSAEQVPA